VWWESVEEHLIPKGMEFAIILLFNKDNSKNEQNRGG
jgi:hypothetical protein